MYFRHESMEKALITGMTGFTGRYAAAALATAGYEVYGTTHSNKDVLNSRVVPCDLTDLAATKAVVVAVRPDVVVHLAAIAFIGHGNVDAMYRTNVVGARNLLQAIADCGHMPRAVLLSSSSNVYGNTTVDVIDETVSPHPANDYAVSKLTMEYMARLWFDQLPITLVRPFNYTGVGQPTSFLVPKIVDHFRRKATTLELGNLDMFRDYSDVRFVVECYRRLLEPGVAGRTRGEVFNICSGVGHSLNEILSHMASIAGVFPEIRVNPAFVRANDVKRLVGSNTKLYAAVGKIQQIPLQETLEWMYTEPKISV